MATAPTLTWEQYQQLPPEKRQRPLTPAEYTALTRQQRIAGGLEEDKSGAPTDFNGPVFPNPEYLQIHDDSEPTIPITRLPEGVTFNEQNWSGSPQMNLAIPAQANVIPAMGREVGEKMDTQPLTPDQFMAQQGAPPGALTPDSFMAQQASAPKPASALSRFGTNFLSGLGVTSDEGAKNFFEHPIKTALDSLNAQGELAQKAKDAYSRGDYKSAIIHGLNYLVPFIGQQTDKAGEQLSQGDIAGGVGRTLGVAAPLVAGSPEARATAGEAASTAAEAVKPVVTKAARVASNIVDPEITGIVSPRLAHVQRALGRAADVLERNKVVETPGTRRHWRKQALCRRTNEPPAPKPGVRMLDATSENKPFAGDRRASCSEKACCFFGNSGPYHRPRSANRAAGVLRRSSRQASATRSRSIRQRPRPPEGKCFQNSSAGSRHTHRESGSRIGRGPDPDPPRFNRRGESEKGSSRGRQASS